MRTRVLGGVLAALTAGVVTAGCANSPTTPPSAATSATATSATPAPAGPAAATAPHNAADMTFLQGMVPHHTQAITMSQLAPDRTASAEVRALAEKIAAAQGPEIEQMNQMLASWGMPPAGGMSGMPGMPGTSPMSGMSGMMSDQQMAQLAAASGPAFDRMFLQMMIEHHTGAIEMARTELAQGQNPEAKALAEKIMGDQQTEILQMRALLGRV